jgi:hypothetical protein
MFWLKMKLIHLQEEVETDIEESDSDENDSDDSDDDKDDTKTHDTMNVMDDDDDDHYNINTYYKNDKKTLDTLVKHLQKKL